MSLHGNTAFPQDWDLSPDIAARLSQAVDDLFASTRQPRDEILAAIISAGLERFEEIGARLAERRLSAVIARLPRDDRAAPDLSAYDDLLNRQGRLA